MKKLLIFTLSICLLATLAACGQKGEQTQETGEQPQRTEEESREEETQTIDGVVNRLGDYLVLLDGEKEYRIFDFGEDVDKDALEEGDRVTVTYTGTLGSEDPAPVAVRIEKAG